MDAVALQIDKALPTPAYLQLKEKLLTAIDRGELPAGTALPSERELADQVGLSRMTVRRAFEELVADQLVEQRQGSGTYVLPKRLEQTLDRVLGFTDEARNLGFRAGSALLEAQPVLAEPLVAEALRLGGEARVLRITRLRTADDAPLALQVAHLAPALSGLSLELLAHHGSLYQAIAAQFGVTPQGARQTVMARLPNRQEVELLDISAHTPVLALERITFGADGRPFEYVRSAYRGDRYRMALELRAP
jgi:GntR family transcriptional regulator